MNLSDASLEWVTNQLEALKLMFDNPTWMYMADAPHTNAQVGYLISLMDIEREGRLELMSLIVGFPLKTSNDARVGRWMFSILIDYYLNGTGQLLNETLGYTSARAIRQAKRLARDAARQAEANQQQHLAI